MKKARGGRRKGSDPDCESESNSVMKLLPNEVKLDILSRLPFDSVLYCKLVCKSWCKSIQNPSFRHIHCGQQLDLDGHSDDKVSFLLLTAEEKSRLYYAKVYDDESRNSCVKFATVNHPFIKKDIFANGMVGSCNGLVCFSVPYTVLIEDPIYICNPSIGEQISLPRFTIMAKNKNNVMVKKTTYLDGHIVSGFGYNSVIDAYKVVRIYYADPVPRMLNKPKGEAQVYTLGSGSGWRNIGACPYRLRSLYFPDHVLVSCVPLGEVCPPNRGILADGALHWLDEDCNIVSFDLVNENFSLLPLPPCFRPGEKNFYILQVLGGCLCVVNDNNGTCLDIWSFEKMTSEWANMFAIPCQSDKFIDVHWPISLTSSGKIILRFDYKTLHSYDPQTSELKLLMDCTTEFLCAPSPHSLIEAIPHTNSFVSLKTLGERPKKIVRVLEINDYEAISD